MLIDTHCHLDAAEFDADRHEVVAQAARAGVGRIVIPAVERSNFDTVRTLAHAMPGGHYALGIHPLYVRRAADADLRHLREAIEQAMSDPRFVAIGEIGLDFFVKELASGPAREKQEHFYRAQLDMAVEFGLPLLLHVRRSQDILLKYLRRLPRSPGGIAHAYNGSDQQTDAFIAHGFVLGVGGEMTYERSRQIRRHAQNRDLAHLVLETDSPDIPPAWLPADARRNTPAQVLGVAQALAQLRQAPLEQVIEGTWNAARRVLPRLALIEH